MVTVVAVSNVFTSVTMTVPLELLMVEVAVTAEVTVKLQSSQGCTSFRLVIEHIVKRKDLLEADCCWLHPGQSSCRSERTIRDLLRPACTKLQRLAIRAKRIRRLMRAIATLAETGESCQSGDSTEGCGLLKVCKLCVTW